MRRRRGLAGSSWLVLAAVIAVLGALLAPAAASAHAVLEQTQPARGVALERAPGGVSLRFNEPVETSFGAVRVFDARGERVDAGELHHPAGDRVGIALRDDLPEGAYTATYRVVSADSHPVAGGFTFTVGESGGAPAAAVGDLIDGGEAGPVTQGAFGAVRAIAYAAIALAAGGLLFVLVVWLPALRASAGAQEAWRGAAEDFAGRLRTIGLAVAAFGMLASALGIVLQGATAAGTSLWAALDPGVVREVLATRFGTVWGLRLVAFGLLGLVLALPGARMRVPVLRPASLGATGLVVDSRRRLATLGPLVLVAALLVLSPALAGHPAAGDSALVLVPANALHVIAMSAWVGGIALLLLALPAATRALERSDRTRLLAAVLARFSPLALIAVATLLASGILQSVVHLGAVSDLTTTAFGRAILIKSALLGGLVALGAFQRRRSVPRLRRAAAAGEAPGGAGVLLRRALRGELATMVAVLGVTAALVSYAPTAGAVAGPFSAARDLGPARLELTVEPARVGANEIHLYLFDRRSGAQYDRFEELTVAAEQPEREIGPIELRASKTGPGHYTVRRAELIPAGDWKLAIELRVSEFEELRTAVEVPVP